MKKISIIIPVFNEVNSVSALIKRILSAFKNSGLSYEIIFIDDNSTDGTFKKIKKHKSKKIKLFRKIGKKGKSFSLLEGFKKATGDIIAMIDADLQYPPEVIPGMIKALKNSDIVVANRKNYKDSFVRRFISRSFRIVFGKLLFGMDHDVQSGLKVISKKVIESIKFTPMSPWTFDLEFLHRAKEAGFVIKNFDISFTRRKNDLSKIGFIKTSFEIGINALWVRAKRIHPVVIPAKTSGSMLGAGFMHKRKKLITHTTLHHSQSALSTFIPWQIAFIGLMVLFAVFGIILNYTLAIIIIVAILSGIYFIDVTFSAYVILKSLYFPPELSFSASGIKSLKDKYLPVYSILCPLFHEASILSDFLNSIKKLDWPKNKLDVILLLEKDDKETIRKANSLNLPSYVRKIIVPRSNPQTKPKACNYGLNKAIGEYLVVFDAEDRPDPDQLKKAYLGFQKVPKNVICLQAKLNYFNPHQNLLTRLFTAEYSLWFDVILTGLQSINTTIPLGGTSNHFKTKVLKNLEGWDPFNVTEDCDLGVRLFKKNYKTAIINSTTWEEANSDVKNWLRQRSRWIKGYLQTYLVHNRKPLQFIKHHGIHAFIFQLIIGARMSFMLINPILWLLTISYFTLYSLVGPTIESFYPAPVFYMAVISLAAGNFMYVYNYMIGCAKRRQWNLIKFVYLIPFYWLLASVSATIALYQLIVKPHYWEKTVHGLHLAKIKKQAAETLVETEEAKGGFAFPFNLRRRWAGILANKKTYFGGAFLVGATILANFGNFIFSAYLGRVLSFKDFALVGLAGGFLSFSSNIFGAFNAATNFRSSFLIGKYGERTGYSFWNYMVKKSILLSIFLAAVWFAATPFLMDFFNTDNALLFILFGMTILIGFISGVNLGFISSKLLFGPLAATALADPAAKIAAVLLLVYLGKSVFAFSAVYFGVFATFISGLIIILRRLHFEKHIVPKAEIKKFPNKFFSGSLLTGISMTAFLTLDIILANHFLTAEQAGQYTLLSLVGKMIYFLGGLTAPFLVPYISRSEGANKDSLNILYRILLFTFVPSLVGFIALGIFGYVTVPILFGQKTAAIVPYLGFFTLGMLFYTLSKVFVNYYLVKGIYSFTFLTSFLIVPQLLLIYSFHANPGVIALDMAAVWTGNLLLTASLHAGIKYVKIFESNVSAFVGLFTKVSIKRKSNLNILIFNWRDTQHKWAGGAEVYIQELAKRWVKDGNSVTVFCGNGTKRPASETIDGIQIIRRGGFYMVYVWAFLYYIFKFRGKFDVIIDCENGIPFFTPLYCRKPIFLLIHHVHQEVFRKSLIRPLAYLATFLETKVMPLIYRNIQVITVSPSSKKEILKHKLTKTEPIIIYNGVDLEKFKPGQKSAHPLILYLGRLQFYKSLNIFIRAAKQVLELVPAAEFIIAGEGEEKKKLSKFANKLKIADKIKFLGRVTEKEKIKLFQKAWVFVNPSFMEGWGLTTIEANACGTPAVASDVPGLRDSIKNPNTGILVPYGKDTEFAKSILKLIKNKTLRKSLSKESIEWAKKFAWEKSAAELYSLVSSKAEERKEKVEVRGGLAYLINRIASLF